MDNDVLATVNFRALMLAFLNEPESKGAIIASITLRKPPLAGLTTLMNARFPTLTDGEKTTTGKLVREVAEQLGYRHDQYGIPIDVVDCNFGEGSTYVAVIAVEIAA
ncbi:hypothetical protein [Bradyrhizobium liaoningense]|uniref:hypothetical protein n=1 Tax=Bradyrhizobium liaoningense TaxID=43992 RepID=UPI001BA45AD9|nr:hypothetical protein [Bradyrhizobium liaoningense]MBR0818112.1 hypothetical protein [Bradyrhizobium liaoningense]